MNLYKLAVLSAMAAGSLWSLNASAQLSYNQGDLLLGMRTPGPGNDLIVDIGPASQYVNATGPITISGTYYTGCPIRRFRHRLQQPLLLGVR
jgi:hypothetical protein